MFLSLLNTLGWIVVIGGVLFLLGWGMLAVVKVVIVPVFVIVGEGWHLLRHGRPSPIKDPEFKRAAAKAREQEWDPDGNRSDTWARVRESAEPPT